MNFLNWTIEKDFAITSPQLIAYKDVDGNVANLPQLQFVASVEGQREFYPVVYAVDCKGIVVWSMTYRPINDFDSAFEYAREQVEQVFDGSYEDGILRHDMLNAWALGILENVDG